MMYVVSSMFVVGAFLQLAALARKPGKDFELIAFATLTGVFLAPLTLPHLPYFDLSALALGGLIIYCSEWREHMEWRVKSVARITWLGTNLYLLTYLLNRSFAVPGLLIGLLLALFMRLVESVRFAAQTPEFD